VPAGSDVAALAAIGAAVVVADQATKFAIVEAIGPDGPHGRLEIAGALVTLEYAENRGVAFGLLSGLGPIVTVASLVIVVVLLVHYFLEPMPPMWQTLAVGGIAGGAIGNLVDRVKLGYVVDFIAVGPWPNFNIADSAITLGVLVLLFGWLQDERAHGAPEII
jgi:signal peptidase II